MKKKILIVVAKYYKDISNGLLSSSKRFLPKSSNLKIIEVPGVFEIPITISKNSKKSVLTWFGIVLTPESYSACVGTGISGFKS